MPAIGRIANFSSLRKHNPKEYSIYDAYFGESKSFHIVNFTKAAAIILHFADELDDSLMTV